MELALWTLGLWGLWAFLPKLATLHLPARPAFLLEVGGGVLVAITAVGLLRFDYASPGFWCAYVAGLSSYGGVLMYITILRKGGYVSVTATLTSLYPVVTVALGVLLLGERPSVQRWIGIGVAILALACLKPPPDSNDGSESVSRSSGGR